METTLIDKLFKEAVKAAEKAYAPYSGYSVGAALLTSTGEIYSGCNIENASFSATICAERTAIFKAVSEGKRDFTAIAVAGGKNGDYSEPAFPCGVCRQVMSEFCDVDFKIILADRCNGTKVYLLKELLPYAFSL